MDEEEDRKKLIAKLEKQKEILDLLDEVIVEYALKYYMFSKLKNCIVKILICESTFPRLLK